MKFFIFFENSRLYYKFLKWYTKCVEGKCPSQKGYVMLFLINEVLKGIEDDKIFTIKLEVYQTLLEVAKAYGDGYYHIAGEVENGYVTTFKSMFFLEEERRKYENVRIIEAFKETKFYNDVYNLVEAGAMKIKKENQFMIPFIREVLALYWQSELFTEEGEDEWIVISIYEEMEVFYYE